MNNLSLYTNMPPLRLYLKIAVPGAIGMIAASLTRWLGFSIQSFLIALDKPVPATVLSVSNAFVLPIVLLSLLWPLGLDGVWLNTPINAAIVSLMALFMLRKVKFDQYTRG